MVSGTIQGYEVITRTPFGVSLYIGGHETYVYEAGNYLRAVSAGGGGGTPAQVYGTLNMVDGDIVEFILQEGYFATIKINGTVFLSGITVPFPFNSVLFTIALPNN